MRPFYINSPCLFDAVSKDENFIWSKLKRQTLPRYDQAEALHRYMKMSVWVCQSKHSGEYNRQHASSCTLSCYVTLSLQSLHVRYVDWYGRHFSPSSKGNLTVCVCVGGGVPACVRVYACVLACLRVICVCAYVWNSRQHCIMKISNHLTVLVLIISLNCYTSTQ